MARASKTNTSDTDNATNSVADENAKLKAELAALQADKATLTSELTGARGAVREAQLARMSSQEREIVSAQEACDSRLESLESEASGYESQIAVLADEPGHGAEIAGLTRKLAAAETKLADENRREEYLAGQREKVTATNKQHRESASADGAKLLANGIDVSKLAAPTQAWLEKHPKAFTDVRYAKLAVLAAQKAVDIEGLVDNSPEFFKFIEGELGEGEQIANDDADDQDDDANDEGDDVVVDDRETYVPERPQARAAGPGALAAAPTRHTPTGTGGGRGRTPTLTAQEREVALSLYPNIKSDADKLVRYAEGKKFMANRDNQHFRNN